MRFSARGYAQLNKKLNPDIAVLEGGYAIQGALPYVNLGIVLAMAGMDFSHVQEPDYDAEFLRQDPRITDYIKTVCDHARGQYFNPPARPSKGEEFEGFFSRMKDIYYDTERISESQVESVFICGDCSGAMKIETWSTHNPLSACVEIPINACPRCQEVGQRLIEEAQVKGSYRYIQLINRKEKVYRHWGF